MKKIDPNIELKIEETRKEDRGIYEKLFAGIWVEHAAKWLITIIGGIIVAALMKLILLP